MRPKTQKTVRLVVPGTNMEQELSLSHAERLLDMGTHLNGGWVLPANSEYIYDNENGIRLRTDKTSD